MCPTLLKGSAFVFFMALSSCSPHYKVLHPMRHQKNCYKEHFKPMAVLYYDNLIRKGYEKDDAVYLTNMCMGKIMRNTDILWLDMCVCNKHTIEEYRKYKSGL